MCLRAVAIDTGKMALNQTVELYAGNRSDGSPVQEQVLVEPLSANQYKVLCSPGLVQGIAADDVIDVVAGDRFEVVRRGGNLCIQVYAPKDLHDIEVELTRGLSPLGGRLDGKAPKQVVFTVPAAAGFAAIERVLQACVEKFVATEWYYGNVYDTRDGVTPLNWWS